MISMISSNDKSKKKKKKRHDMLKLHKLFRLENLTMSYSYRGIFLLPVPSKNFCRIQIDRTKQGVDERLPGAGWL